MMSDYYLVRLSYQYGMLVRVKDVVKTWSRDARSIYVHHFLRQSYYQHYHLRLNTLTRICIESCYCRLTILLHYTYAVLKQYMMLSLPSLFPPAWSKFSYCTIPSLDVPATPLVIIGLFSGNWSGDEVVIGSRLIEDDSLSSIIPILLVASIGSAIVQSFNTIFPLAGLYKRTSWP